MRRIRSLKTNVAQGSHTKESLLKFCRPTYCSENTITRLQDVRLPALKLPLEHQFLISSSSPSPSTTIPLCLYASDSLGTVYEQNHRETFS